ncbi:MAG: hypothetical protein ACI8TP_002777 [Acidimicrobiales bacterium]|jgi:hypothetical protein
MGFQPPKRLDRQGQECARNRRTRQTRPIRQGQRVVRLGARHEPRRRSLLHHRYSGTLRRPRLPTTQRRPQHYRLFANSRCFRYHLRGRRSSDSGRGDEAHRSRFRSLPLRHRVVSHHWSGQRGIRRSQPTPALRDLSNGFASKRSPLSCRHTVSTNRHVTACHLSNQTNSTTRAESAPGAIGGVRYRPHCSAR